MRTSSVFQRSLRFVPRAGFALLLLSLVLVAKPAAAQVVGGGEGTSASAFIGVGGTLYVWGMDQYQHTVASKSVAQDSIPVAIAFPSGVTSWKAVALGDFHIIALGNDGNLYAWGPTVQVSTGTAQLLNRQLR